MRIAFLFDRTVLEDHHAIGRPHRFVQIVADEDDGFGHRFLKMHQKRLHFGADQWIKRRKCFVHQEDVSVVCQRAGQPDALAHATRKLRGVTVLVPLLRIARAKAGE